MSRRPNALYRLLALLLALSLCPALGLAQEPTESPYALRLTWIDAQTGAPMQTDPVPLAYNEVPLHWITLPENIALHTVTVEFLMRDAGGEYFPVEGFFYDVTIEGITPLEIVDFSTSEAIPARFRILNPADPSAVLYDSALTLSHTEDPNGVPGTDPTDSAPTDSAPTDSAPTDSAPTDSAPTDSAPTDSAPTDSAPTEDVPTVTPAPTFPTDIPDTEHAYVNVVYLPVYSDVGGALVDERMHGEIVQILDHKLGPDGTWWSLISIDGVTGYVQTLDLLYMTHEEEARYLEELNATPTPDPTETPTPSPDPTETPTPSPDPTETPTPSPDPTETPTPSPDPTETPTPSPDPTETPTPSPDPTETPTPSPDPTETPTPSPDPTETPTPSPDPTETPTPSPEPTLERETGYAYVIKASVNVRPSPSSNIVLQVLQNNDVIEVIDHVFTSQGEKWHHVQLPSKQLGYVRSDLVRIMTWEEENAYLRAMNITPSPSPTPTPTPTPTPSPTPTASPTAAPPQVAGYARSVAANAPVLNWPNLGASPLYYLDYGQVVYVQEQVYPNDNTKWHYVYHNGTYGYALGGYLKMMTPDEVAAYFAGQIVTTPSPAPTQYTSAFSGYGVLTTNSVRFRTTPNGSTQHYLPKNTIVRLISSVQQDGYTWYQAESGGTIGYLRDDVLRLLTVSEYLSIRSDPSYTSGNQVITPTLRPNTTTGDFTWSTPSITNIPNFVTSQPTASPTATLLPTATPWATRSPDPSPSVSPLASPSPTPTMAVVPGVNNGRSPGSSLLLALAVLAILIVGGLYGFSMYNRARKQQLAREAAQRRAAEVRKQAQDAAAAPRAAVRTPDPAPGAAAGRPSGPVGARQPGTTPPQPPRPSGAQPKAAPQPGGTAGQRTQPPAPTAAPRPAQGTQHTPASQYARQPEAGVNNPDGTAIPLPKENPEDGLSRSVRESAPPAAPSAPRVVPAEPPAIPESPDGEAPRQRKPRALRHTTQPYDPTNLSDSGTTPSQDA